MSGIFVTFEERLEIVSLELIRAYRELRSHMIDKLDEIKEFIEQCQSKIDERDYIFDSWIVPARIHLMNQVIIRKPTICRARSNCYGYA